MLQTLKHLVPEPWRRPIRSAYSRLRHAGWRHRCNICGAGLRNFLPHGIPPEPNFLCPLCRSKPPHRLASAYFDTHPELFVQGAVLLHVAPEPGLGGKIAEQARRHDMTYRAGGLNGVGDHYLDLLDLPIASESIALVYCCHVLNCMEDDRRAMREVYRVLHPDGLAILQVPAFYPGETTLETNGRAERMATFGDDGIYRCYTNNDYEVRLRSVGFEVTAFRANNVAANFVELHQLKQEVLHLCRKPRGADA